MTAHDPAALLRRLEQVLLSDLPPKAANHGARLASHMKGPMRIVLVGRPGVGKGLLAKLLDLLPDLRGCEISRADLGDDPAPLWDATARADIVLWCGQGFGTVDSSLWAKMPDVLKDHSFLVLTKADLLARQGELDATLRSLDLTAADEFHSLFPLATPQAIAACGPGQSAAFRASGAAALKTALLHQISLYRTATHDGACLFLDRYEILNPAAPTVPTPATQSADLSWANPLAYLRDQAEGLQVGAALPLPAKIQAILQHCCATAEQLANMMEPFAQNSAEDIAQIEEVFGVADTMVLLQLEGSASAATDALSLLLQLRRDLAVLDVR